MRNILKAYVDLIKYRLSLAVVLSAVTGYLLAGTSPGTDLIFLAVGIFLLSAGSATLNQYTERDSDAIMGRTMNRPLPQHIISAIHALIFSIVLLVSGGLFLLFINLQSFLLGIINVFIYNIVYTRLKKATLFSIVPGALVGALPPVIGFFAAGGLVLNSELIAFSSFMFLWQIPHFWLIIIRYGKEYREAGFASISKYLTEAQIRYLVFSWVLLTTGFIFIYFMVSETLERNLFVFFCLLNIVFIYLFHRLLFSVSKQGEIKGAFALINTFGILIMCLLIVESLSTLI
jgi:heme o synthase